MATAFNASPLVAELKDKVTQMGLRITSETPDGFSGEMEAIKSKWWFGGRKAAYRMSCRADEGEHTVVLRESVVNRSWGLPPPAITFETETVSGWSRSGKRTDTSVGGGGSLDYGRVRSTLEEAALNAGWEFRVEGPGWF